MKRVCLYLDRDRTLRWHHWLVDALTASGNQVYVRFSARPFALPSPYATLLAAEKLAYNLRKSNRAIDPIEPSQLPADPGAEPFDVLINTAAEDGTLPAAKRVLTPCFNGMPTVFGAIWALISHASLEIQIYDSDRSVPLSAVPALADREILTCSLDNLLSVTTGLIVKSLATPSRPSTTVTQPRNPPKIVAAGAYAYATASFLKKAGKYLQILAAGHRTWAIAWRYDSMPLLDRGTATFNVLPTPKGHYYADPFPVRRNGSDFIFVEDFNFATGYACIAVATLNGEQITAPTPIIDTGYHLSYPFVFEHAGETWMIPESGDVGDIYIYRAVRFPYEWQCEGTLIHGIEGFDATLTTPQIPDEPFWLFVSERMWNSTGWDAVSLFHSDKLIGGQWVPHKTGNPLLFDARYSRSGGQVFRHHGRLIRPVQDCVSVYGGAVNICQIDRLDSDEFVQTVIGSIRCASTPGMEPYIGCHTYNFADGLEVIDLFDRNIGREVTAHYEPIIQTETQPVLEPLSPAPVLS